MRRQPCCSACTNSASNRVIVSSPAAKARSTRLVMSSRTASSSRGAGSDVEVFAAVEDQRHGDAQQRDRSPVGGVSEATDWWVR